MDLERQKIKTGIDLLFVVCRGGYQTRIINFAVAMDKSPRSFLRSILD